MKKNQWYDLINLEFKKDYFLKLKSFLIEEYAKYNVYPEKKNILRSIEVTDYNNVKVVILGQDPYHGPNQAHGLSFSVQKGSPNPPSLQNIFKELNGDIGCKIPTHGNLDQWAHQGVLLLNTVLTVRKGKANSHRDKGWEVFTDKLISLLNERDKPVIFVFWGGPAKTKRRFITNKHHYIIESSHPSPLSAFRGFFGSKPFSKINKILCSIEEDPIDWQIN